MSKQRHGERGDLRHLPLREEPVGDPTLIEHLDGARVQTAGARADELLAGAPLDDGDVDPRQRQLARQHQPRRTPSGDHHLHARLIHNSRFRRFLACGGALCGTPQGLKQAPHSGINWKWKGVWTTSVPGVDTAG